jgi:hypothetical protein
MVVMNLRDVELLLTSGLEGWPGICNQDLEGCCDEQRAV